MILRPATRDALSTALRAASETGRRIKGYDLASLAELVHHTPEDMTVATEAGMSLADLQTRLRSRGQWLPVDPPNPDSLSIGALLAANPSGPRRFGYGTVREHLIGVQAVLPDGRLIKAGGNVVKNVAGYDLCRLFVGSRGALGCIVEATFKLWPLPGAERFVKAAPGSLQQAEALTKKLLASNLSPIAIDWAGGREAPPEVIVGFAGSEAEARWQAERAVEMGFDREGDLSHETAFWEKPAAASPVRTVSVLPSRLAETLEALEPGSYVARAGNGQIHFRGGSPVQAPDNLPLDLLRRLKKTYDPNGILPAPPWL